MQTYILKDSFSFLYFTDGFSKGENACHSCALVPVAVLLAEAFFHASLVLCPGSFSLSVRKNVAGIYRGSLFAVTVYDVILAQLQPAQWRDGFLIVH